MGIETLLDDLNIRAINKLKPHFTACRTGLYRWRNSPYRFAFTVPAGSYCRSPMARCRTSQLLRGLPELALHDWWESRAEDLFFHFTSPMENGHRSDVEE